ncbi:PLD nuclease N-terminal domain-containing protein [Leucobacter sp. W1153]|uniref:PLD nuclease N-terminal domain-containing protein n=1 Tax=Leucobacter sp. W1153 TaxID=3439064 RepID=UPI003F389EFC
MTTVTEVSRAVIGYSDRVLLEDMLLPLTPLLALTALLIVWSLVDIARRPSVRHLPKWAWAIITLMATPLGAILYLVIGRENSRALRDEDLR